MSSTLPGDDTLPLSRGLNAAARVFQPEHGFEQAAEAERSGDAQMIFVGVKQLAVFFHLAGLRAACDDVDAVQEFLGHFSAALAATATV